MLTLGQTRGSTDRRGPVMESRIVCGRVKQASMRTPLSCGRGIGILAWMRYEARRSSMGLREMRQFGRVTNTSGSLTKLKGFSGDGRAGSGGNTGDPGYN